MSVRQLFDLTGKTALVTGGSRGLGLQIADALGEMGANLVLCARKDDELEAARAQLTGRGYTVAAVRADLATHDGPKQLVDATLARCPRIDILVNNAGATWGASAEDMPFDAWQKVVNLNLTGTFLLTQEVGRRSMIPNRYGRVVIVASIAGLRGNASEEMRAIGYNTTKGGLVNFTRALAAEWGRHNITVNAIAPGWFPSKMSQGVLARIGADVLERTPLHRLGDDEDLKGVAVLLASDASRHITGQIVSVDGGATAI